MHQVATIPSILDQGEFEWYTVTEHGMTFKRGTPRDKWLETVNQAAVMHESSGRLHFRAICILADALNYGEEEYGEEYAQAIDDTRAWMKQSHKTISNAMWVMKQIPPERRRETLTLSHHAEVAALPAEEQDELLNQAEENSMTVAELRKAIKERHPKTKRGKARKTTTPKNELIAITNATECKHALTLASNWLTENEDRINDSWRPLLEHFHKLFRRRWQNGRAKQ